MGHWEREEGGEKGFEELMVHMRRGMPKVFACLSKFWHFSVSKYVDQSFFLSMITKLTKSQ